MVKTLEKQASLSFKGIVDEVINSATIPQKDNDYPLKCIDFEIICPICGEEYTDIMDSPSCADCFDNLLSVLEFSGLG